MYIFSLTIFFIISISLIILIIMSPSKNNIVGSSKNTNTIQQNINNLKYFKNDINYNIKILAILFFITNIILNNIYNKKTQNYKNKNFIQHTILKSK